MAAAVIRRAGRTEGASGAPYNRGMVLSASEVLEYGALAHTPPVLFLDYVAGREGAAPFFDGGRWDLDAIAAAAERTAAATRPREAVAGVLSAQQAARGASRAAKRATLLASQDAVAVVTGQQACLFGGPLYVLYKALATVELASRLEARRGAPVVPVFWVASDDHDFEEIRSLRVLDSNGAIAEIRYTPRQEPHGRPASAIVLDDSIGGAVEGLRTTLPESAHRETLLSLVADAYRPGISVAAAFARLLSSLLPELVVLDPAAPELKALARSVMTREVGEGSPSSRLAAEAGERLRAAGYHEQVAVRPGFLNLFARLDEERRPLALENGGLEVRGLSRHLSLEEAARLIDADPARWSPGALLRPLVQDALLPTAAYVGGPAEICYHAQIGPSYAHFGVPRPVLVPRPGVTLVEPSTARALEAEGLRPADLQGDPEAIITRWAQTAHPEVEAGFTRVRQAIEDEMGRLEEHLGSLDPTLRAAAAAGRGRALHAVEQLEEKSLRALRKREEMRGARLRRARNALFPGGELQERTLGGISLLARHGVAVLDELRRRVELFAPGHQVLSI